MSDFGLALLVGPNASDPTLTGLRGTPAYMAPEQTTARPSAIGPAADIYAMGTILFELLTGRSPFQGASTIETIDLVRNQEPVMPRRLNAAIPRDLEVICLKCLEKDPGRRYPSAAAMASDLQAFLDVRPIAARPVSSFERGWRWCRRHPSVAALAIALMMSLSLGFLSVVVLWRRAESERTRAEADFRTATEVLHQFVEFTTEITVPKVFDARSLIPLFENTRGRLLDIVRKRPGSDRILRELARLDLRLGDCLGQEGRWDEALTILEESFERLGELSRRVPLDRSAWVDYLWACRACADVAEHQKRPEVSLFYLQRAVEVGGAIARRWPAGEALDELARMRSDLARPLARRGDRAAALALLQANVRMFAPRPGQTVDHPGVAACCIMAAIEIHRHRSRFADGTTDSLAAPTETASSSDPLAVMSSPATDALPAPSGPASHSMLCGSRPNQARGRFTRRKPDAG